ncbi:Mur ligase family protein, partial [Vibrio cholerae]|uniref:Mur ligase family protein n=1 Tax=Vibrio cholerae TaxID=666 RepID=UPI001F0AB5D7
FGYYPKQAGASIETELSSHALWKVIRTIGRRDQGYFFANILWRTREWLPDVALVNNVAAAHLEGFGSMDGVKRAKGEIYQGLQAGAVAIVNLDSNGGDYWK